MNEQVRAARIRRDEAVAGVIGEGYAVYDDTVPFVNVRKKADEALGKLKVLSQDHQVSMLPNVTNCEQVRAEL